MDLCAGPLYIEVSGVWEEMFFSLKGPLMVGKEKLRGNIPSSISNSGEIAVEINLPPGEIEVKQITMSLFALSKLMKTSEFTQTPYFFQVKLLAENIVYRLASASNADRTRWMESIRNVSKPRVRNANSWMRTGLLAGSTMNTADTNMFSKEAHQSSENDIRMTESSPSRNGRVVRHTSSLTSPSPNVSPSRIQDANYSSHSPRNAKSNVLFSDEKRQNNDINDNYEENEDDFDEDDIDEDEDSVEIRRDKRHYNSLSPRKDAHASKVSSEDDDFEERIGCYCFTLPNRILGIKVETIVRLSKVCLAFPFVIVSASVQASGWFAFMKSVTIIRMMNILIYVVPVILVRYVLSQYPNGIFQKTAIGLYILLYLAPVGSVAFAKLKVASSTHKIEEGTFCFKPARSVRVSQANFYSIVSSVFEWMQHVLYVLPTGITTKDNKEARLSSFPPYLSFEVYFWTSVACSFACGLILILNSVLRGKIHYKFQKSYVVWFFLYNVGTPMYVTIVTIMFMALSCDYSVDPPILIQDPNIVCYSPRHTSMAQAALMTLAVYLIQNTLLPSGTFKETMRDDELDIMFVPVYLQVHFLFKAIFCGIYVFFYTDNVVRVIILTFINLVLLGLNNFMKPCSVEWVNVLRDTFFIHACISGIQSLNYLAWPANNSTSGMVVSTLASNIFFASITMYIYFKYTTRSTEYTIAKSFLDLEWQVSRGGSVHPRVLEPLISLTLSKAKEDYEIAQKYIGQLVWLISYPNMRVQFQSAWGLANLALVDNDARVKIHKSGGTHTLFEWYMDMDFVVQLETLAAMANLTLSREVVDEMVAKYKCIPFFINLVASNKLKHSQFASIALANIASQEKYREMIRKYGGIQSLVGCIMSHDYYKRRYGCLALANMALSSSSEIEQVFESKGLLDRIIKMATRKEIETQREVIALLRNLSCHGRLRPLLLDRGIMAAVEASLESVFDDVREWCGEIKYLMTREIEGGSIDLKALLKLEGPKGLIKGNADMELLKKMTPLEGKVEWSTWGSKLESIFSPIFSTLPSLQSIQVMAKVDNTITISLSSGIAKSLLKSWKDNLTFVVVEKPAHGRLSDLTTTSDTLQYTPFKGYIGTDFFTYRLQLGGMSTWPATVSIRVEHHNAIREDEDEDIELAAHRDNTDPSTSHHGTNDQNPKSGEEGDEYSSGAEKWLQRVKSQSVRASISTLLSQPSNLMSSLGSSSSSTSSSSNAMAGTSSNSNGINNNNNSNNNNNNNNHNANASTPTARRESSMFQRRISSNPLNGPRISNRRGTSQAYLNVVSNISNQPR